MRFQYRFIFYLALLGVILMSACKATVLAKDNAGEQIQKLKTGYLLVRLKTKAEKVEVLEKMREDAKAEKVKVMQQEANERIIAAFSEYYNFSSVYFFYGKDGPNIRQGKSTGLFNAVGDPVLDTLFLNNSYYLVAEFGGLENESGAGVAYGIKVMDKDYSQLKRPFPATTGNSLYERHASDFQSRLVRAFNKRLEQFHLAALKRASRRSYKKERRALRNY